MVLYGKVPTQEDLDYNKKEAQRTDFPVADGEVGGKKYWNCTRNDGKVRYKIGYGSNPFGQYFTFFYSGENQIVEYVLRRLPPSSTVVDVGAACGSFTLPFLVAGHPVHSFELETASFNDMMGHIRLNSDVIKPEHINGYNFGLWSSDVVGDFYDIKNARFKRLDDVLPDLTGVSFLKVDVEGAELEVLKGGAQLIQRNKPMLWVECHEIFHKGITQKVLPFLKELGCFAGFTVKEFTLVSGTNHLLLEKT